MLGGADNPNGELLSYIIGADNSSVLVQKLQLAQGTDTLPGLFDTGQQCCRICFILIVVKDNSRFAVDIVLQPRNQNIQCGFRG